MADRTHLEHQAPPHQPSGGEWRQFWLLLIPVGCCGLPVLFGALAATGAVVIGGTIAAVGVLGGAVVVFALVRRRRRPGARQPKPVDNDERNIRP